MADFSSTKRNATFAEWCEQVELIIELNCVYNHLDVADLRSGYEAGKQVADFFYDNFETED